MENTESSFIIINGLKYPFACKEVTSGTSIVIDASVERRHIEAVNKAVNGKDLTPMVTYNSHQDVYITALIFKALGISQEVQLKAFLNWTRHADWIKLWKPEYLYLCYSLIPETVNINRFIREKPSECLTWVNSSLSIPASVEISNIIGLLEFITAMRFDQFDEPEVDPDVVLEFSVAKLNEIRNELVTSISEKHLNPFTEESKRYLVYTPGTAPVWSAEGISKFPRQEVLESTIVTKEVFLERLDRFACGLLTTPQNPNYPKVDGKWTPPKNSVIAGGFAKLLNPVVDPKNLAGSDLDIFVCGSTKEEKYQAYESWLQWFKSDNTFFSTIGSVTTVLFMDIPRKVQIVSTSEKTPLEVVSRFDFTDRQWFYHIDTNEVRGTISAFKSLRSLTSCINLSGSHNIKTDRAVKTLYYGFDLEKNQIMIDEHVDITDFIKNPADNDLRRMLRGFAYTYTPKSDPSIDRKELVDYIYWMIEKETNAKLVTQDINDALTAMVISGNFACDYDSLLYTNFSVARVDKPHGIPARRKFITVKNQLGGFFKLMTPTLTVDRVSTDDTGVTIKSKFTDLGFQDFINTCETTLFTHIRGMNASKKMIEADNKLTIKFPAYKLDAQLEKGVALMQNQSGIALSVEEDLTTDDTFQMIFYIRLCVDGPTTYVEFVPCKLIKFQMLEVKRIEMLNEVAKPVEATPPAVINYEEVTYDDNL